MVISGTEVLVSIGTSHELFAFDYDDPDSFYTGSGAFAKFENAPFSDGDIFVMNAFEELVALPASLIGGVAGAPLITTVDAVARYDDTIGNLKNSINTTITDLGAITTASNLDTTHTFGRCRIGSPFTDTAFFSHIDKMDANNYAIRQDSLGLTRLNSQSGQDLEFRIGDVLKAEILSLTGDFDMTAGNGSILVDPTEGINPGTDDDIRINRCHLGPIAINDFAVFAHEDQATSTNYAFYQTYYGEVGINKPSGEQIRFAEDDVTVGIVEDGGQLVWGHTAGGYNGVVYFRQNTNVGSVSGDNVVSMTHGVDENTNVCVERHYWVRNAAGSDWTTISHHNGIAVDISYISPTTSRCYWERDINAGEQEWGDQGTPYMQIKSDGIYTCEKIAAIDDLDTYMRFDESNHIMFYASGSIRARINWSGFQSDISTNTAANPQYSWAADEDLGMYRIGSNHLGFSAGNNLSFGVKANLAYVSARDQLGLWGTSTNYSFQMDNSSFHQYGPVTGYSIKSNMNSTSGRGWVWGVESVAPKHAFGNTGDFQHAGDGIVEGDLEVDDFLFLGNASGVTISSNAITVTTSSHVVNTTGTINDIHGDVASGQLQMLVLIAGFGYTVTIAHGAGASGSNVIGNTGANITFTSLESTVLFNNGSAWFMPTGTNP